MKNRHHQLLDELRQGTVCLTANKRLARQAMEAYDRLMIASGARVWSRPAVQTLDSWCRMLAEPVARPGLILSPNQAVSLWERIIRDDIATHRHPLLQIVPTAKKAYEANGLLLDYETTVSPTEAADDHRAFLRWRESWTVLLEANNWIDPARLTAIVSEALDRGSVTPPEAVCFIGFDDFTPSRRTLIETLGRAGTQVRWLEEETVPDAAIRVYAAPDRSVEVDRCARWLRKIARSEPEARVGIVTPFPERYRALVQHRFPAELDPPACLSGSDEPLPFTISLGRGLLEEGAVAAAVRLLSLPGTLQIDDLSWLLRTPYVAGGTSRSARRGQKDFGLRQLKMADFPLWKLPRLLRGIGCDREIVTVASSLESLHRSARPDRPGAWAESFARLLEACGWPGDRPLSSREFQAIEKFRELLIEMASLDTVSGSIDKSAAVALLQRLARETLFQPEAERSRIQVLGLLEAGGLTFDHLWILGLHAGALPQPLRPNPFIPRPVQRRAQMPHSDPERELDYAGKVIDRLFGAAPNVIASWPVTDDGMENRPTLFLSGIPTVALPEDGSASPAATIFRNRPPLACRSDVRAAPLVTQKPVKGGTAIVRDQALCPFRAFAHHRLMAQGLESPEIGIDHLTRGTLVHSLLEHFWEETGSHGELVSLDVRELAARMERAAERAVAREESARRSNFPERSRRLEIDRLVRQGMKWLEIERRRGAFTVLEHEKIHRETIGRLQFRVRIDRLDKLADGTLAIIDYKTGQPDPLQWFEDRISEPQLPIYCHEHDNADIGAVVFAVVRTRPGECRFAGLARNAGEFPGISESRLQALLAERGWRTLDDVLANWKSALPRLGDAFAGGEAAVDPVSREKACLYCDLMPLCRIHEADRWGRWGGGHD